jgi:RsbT co-antagonist protein rsbRD N-terminal domain
MLLAYRLVRLIEAHADELARNLLENVKHSGKTSAYTTHVPQEELRSRVREVYQNLGEWLLGKTEADVQRRYEEIGARRAAQGVPLTQLISALVLTKDTLWEYLLREAVVERPVEVFGELELLQLLDQFFDRAVYYAAAGYEHAAGSHAAGARHGAA